MLPLAIPLVLAALYGELASSPNASLARGSYIEAPPAMVSAKGGRSGSRILYLNRCIGGCSVSPGFEDSRTNTSSILGRAIELSEWSHSDKDWDNMVNCVRQLYRPFDVVVTDVDPGDRSHFEAMVAGTPLEGSFTRAGGVSPFTCGIIENAITFTYAAIYDDMREICNIVGQESAHALGLDHELDCSDPLTYLPGCPIKSFQDTDAACGEFVERECSCGGDTQNSVQYLLDVFGEGLVPEVRIESPQEASEVSTGFTIRATGVDDHDAMTRAELWIDGVLLESQESEDVSSVVFSAPKTLSPDKHEIEVRIFDDRNQYGTSSITVTQGECQAASECDFSYLCLAGQCVLGPGNVGGLGASCQGPTDCDGDICATKSSGDSVCTAFCDRAPQACPSAYECVQTTGERSVCIAQGAQNTGGCTFAGSRSGGPLGFLCFLLALCGTRRHHGKRRNPAPESGSH